jgi:hypothetical protein
MYPIPISTNQFCVNQFSLKPALSWLDNYPFSLSPSSTIGLYSSVTEKGQYSSSLWGEREEIAWTYEQEVILQKLLNTKKDSGVVEKAKLIEYPGTEFYQLKSKWLKWEMVGKTMFESTHSSTRILYQEPSLRIYRQQRRAKAYTTLEFLLIGQYQRLFLLVSALM